MLHIASSFVLYQAGLPVGSAPYKPTQGKDLRSSALRVFSILKTAAKVSILSPELFVSQNLDEDWSLIYSNAWILGAARNPAEGVWDLPSLPSALPLLEMLPSLAMMLSMHTVHRKVVRSPNGHNMTDLISPAPVPSSSKAAANMLIAITSFLSASIRQALISPILVLDILTSQPVWTILEATREPSASDIAGRRTASLGDSNKTLPQPSASSQQEDELQVPGPHELWMAISLSAFLACLVDSIFYISTSLPSFLAGGQDNAPPDNEFIAFLVEQVAATLQLLFAAHQGRDDISFLSVIMEVNFMSSIDSSPTTTSGDRSLIAAASGDLGDLSVMETLSTLSHILSSHVWDVLLDQLPVGETMMGMIASSLMTFSLYQAVAVVEKCLPALSFISESTPGAKGAVLMTDVDLGQQLRGCRADVVKALLVLCPQEKTNSTSANVSWTTALPLLHSSLLQLRDIVKSSCSKPFVARDWELIKVELLLSEAEETWGSSSCCNAACTRLEGPCEVEVKTLICGGGCEARYCIRTCQQQAWRAGHRRNCEALRGIIEDWYGPGGTPQDDEVWVHDGFISQWPKKALDMSLIHNRKLITDHLLCSTRFLMIYDSMSYHYIAGRSGLCYHVLYRKAPIQRGSTLGSSRGDQSSM